MIIYTETHLNEVGKYLIPKIDECLSCRFNLDDIGEFVSTLAGFNSHTDLVNELKRSPVDLGHDNVGDRAFDLLPIKHNLTLTNVQKEKLISICNSNPVEIMYSPECNFPVSSVLDFLGPETQNPLLQLKKNAIDFFNLSRPLKTHFNKYPDMYLEAGCDIDEAIEDYIEEHINTGFCCDKARQEGLSEKTISELYCKSVKEWRVANKDKIEDMKAYALQQTAAGCYSYLLEAGGVVECESFKISTVQCSDEFREKLIANFSENSTLIYWRTIKPDTQFLLEGESLGGDFIATQILYIGVLDAGKFTAIGTASSFTLRFFYSHESSLLYTCDAHSACMNDVYKEIRKYLAKNKMSWSEFIESMSEDFESCITKTWSRKNIFDDDHVDAFSVGLLTKEFQPMRDDTLEIDRFYESTRAPEIFDSCILLTEVCGARQVDATVNVANADNFIELSKGERPRMSDDERITKARQVKFSECLEGVLKGSNVTLICYDPWSHALS